MTAPQKAGNLMNSYTQKAIILRETNVGESNKILTMLVKDVGKISCTAVGCRRTKSKLFSCSSMFCYGDFEISTVGKYPHISQAIPIESFYNLRTDLDILAYGTYIAEIIEKTTPEGMESNESMLLLLKTLQRLNSHQDPVLVCTVFKLRLLSILGYIPYLDGCNVCNKPALMLTTDGLKCDSCLHNNEPYISVNPTAINLCKFIFYDELKKIFAIQMDNSLLIQLKQIANFLFKAHIDINFKTYKFISQLEANKK